jgi:hypothetical protein
MMKKYAIFVKQGIFGEEKEDHGYEILYSFDTIEPMLDWIRLQNLAILHTWTNPNDEPPNHLLPHFDFDEDWYGTVWKIRYPLFYGQEIYL